MGTSISDRWAVALAEFVVHRRWLVIAATLIAIGAGARHLEFSNNYRVFFGAENPELIAFEKYPGDLYQERQHSGRRPAQ